MFASLAIGGGEYTKKRDAKIAQLNPAFVVCSWVLGVLTLRHTIYYMP